MSMIVRARSQSHLDVFRKAKREAHEEAAKELVTVIVLSAFPFLIGAFAFMIFNDEQALGLKDYLSSLLLQGQLFLVAVSFLATSLQRLWNSDQSYRRPDIINIFAILLFSIIGIIYGKNPEFAKLTSFFSRISSIIFLIISFLFYYYTAVLSYDRPLSIEQSLASGAKDTAERLRTLRARSENGGE